MLSPNRDQKSKSDSNIEIKLEEESEVNRRIEALSRRASENNAKLSTMTLGRRVMVIYACHLSM